jgi:tetratricopeptide (TPR) repeat protein
MRQIKFSIFNSILLVLGLIFTVSNARAQSADEALKLLDLEKIEAATSTIKKAIEKDSKNAANYYYAGFIYLELDKADSAKMYFDKGVEADPKNPLPYVGQGYIALNGGKAQVAQGLFDKAIDLSKGKDAVVYNKIADALLHADNKDPNKAMTYLTKATEAKKDKDKANQIAAETQLLMGDAHLALKDGGKAISSYESAATTDKGVAAKAYAKIGRIYLIPKNYDAAQAEFDKGVAADPNFAPIYKDLAELYFTKRDINKAKEMLGKYMQLSDVQKGSRSRIAVFTYLTRDYPAAINEIREALKTDPDNIVLHRLLGYSLNKTGDFAGAKASLDKYFSLVKPDKTLASDYVNLGQAQVGLGEDSLAVGNFMTAVDKDTANIEMIGEVAEDLRKAKKNNPAAKMYDVLLARKQNPTTNDYYRAGNAFLGAKQYAKADSAYQKVIDATPDNYLGYNALMTSKLYQDPEAKAGTGKEVSEKLISILEPDAAAASDAGKKRALITAYGYLASHATQKEDLKTAGAYWDKVEKVDPANQGPKAFRDYLKQVENYKKAQQQQQKKSSASK